MTAERDMRSVFGSDFTLVCPKNLDELVQTGNKMNENFKQVQVKFRRCVSNEFAVCLTNFEIEQYIQNTRLVMFAPKNEILLGELEEKPLYTEYVKVFEQELSSTYMKETTIQVKLSEAAFFDWKYANILAPTSEFKFLTYVDNSNVMR